MNANGPLKDFEPAEPTPLLRATSPGEPYPLDALGPLRTAAEAIHDMTQAPAAIGAQSALGAAALAVQGLADVEALHGRAPVSLYLLTVAQSGERKSACDRLAMQAVRDFEAEQREAFKDELTAWRNRHDIWKAKRDAIIKSAKGSGPEAEAARADLDALGPEPEAPLYPSIVAGEPTLEGIVKNLDRSRAALGLFNDEGGAFIGGHGMKAEDRLKTVAGLSRFWDGSALDRWRAGDGVSSYPGRRLSAHLMAQPVAAAGLLADPTANGQGFLARFLMTEPPSAIGTRLRVGHATASEAALTAFSARLGERLRRPLPLRERTRNEVEPPLLALSAEARGVLEAFYLATERAQTEGGDLEAARPFASKAAEHAARLAAVLTLFADPDAREVAGETMADAVTLTTFYANEAVRLADAATVSAETADAEKLRRWLLDRWPEPFVSASDVAQRGPFKETSRARRALVTLERFGWVIVVEGGATVLGKRRREAWRIVRGAG